MLIKSAWAAPAETTATTSSTVSETGAAMPAPPGPGEAFAMNMGLVLILVVLFYLLLIRPQQKRFKDHAEMLKKLDNGTKIVTQGGLVGTIEKEISEYEVLVDFGNNVEVTTMRSAIMGRYEDALPKAKVANDDKKAKEKVKK